MVVFLGHPNKGKSLEAGTLHSTLPSPHLQGKGHASIEEKSKNNKKNFMLNLKECWSHDQVVICFETKLCSWNFLPNENQTQINDFFIWIIFILLSRESDVGAIHRTNPDTLRSCLYFRVFWLSFASDFFNLLLVKFHQAEIIIVKHLIQGRNNKAWMEVEPSTLRSWPS